MTDDLERVNIDGCDYPKYKNIISTIHRDEPRLLSDEYEAKEIRRWLRENTDGEQGQWILVLCDLARFFNFRNKETEEEKKVRLWRDLESRVKDRKIRRIVNAIDKLKKELKESEDVLNIPKLYGLMDCYFASSPRIAFLLQDFCIEKDKKNPFDEDVIDLIEKLRGRMIRYGKIHRGGSKKGNRQMRLAAIGFFRYLNSKYKQGVKINKLIVLLLNLRYPSDVISYEMVNSWVLRFKKKEEK